jgi:histidinol-phosphate aminotransferase
MENNKKIMEDADMYFREMKKMGFKPFKTHANFILAKLPDAEFNLLSEELPKRGIIIKFFKEPVFENYIRISIGTREQNEFVIENMKEILSRK